MLSLCILGRILADCETVAFWAMGASDLMIAPANTMLAAFGALYFFKHIHNITVQLTAEKNIDNILNSLFCNSKHTTMPVYAEVLYVDAGIPINVLTAQGPMVMLKCVSNSSAFYVHIADPSQPAQRIAPAPSEAAEPSGRVARYYSDSAGESDTDSTNDDSIVFSDCLDTVSQRAVLSAEQTLFSNNRIN